MPGAIMPTLRGPRAAAGRARILSARDAGAEAVSRLRRRIVFRLHTRRQVTCPRCQVRHRPQIPAGDHRCPRCRAQGQIGALLDFYRQAREGCE